MSETPATKTFEEDLTELESVVKLLEEGNLPLEESIDIFEKGINLVKTCQTKLNQAKIRIEKISVDSDTQE